MYKVIKRLKFIIVILLLKITALSSAETFDSYGFDKAIGNTDVLIGIKDNKIIFEKYANDYDFNRPHMLHSINKLFINAFVGNLEKVKLLSVMSPIPNSVNDVITAKLSVDALLRMSSGLRAVADPDTMEAIGTGIIRPVENFPDKIFDYYLLKSLPMYAPNANYNYCFYDNNLLIQHLEDRFGKYFLKDLLKDFLERNKFYDTRIFILPSERYLLADYNTFLNKILLQYNSRDQFQLAISRQFGFSSARDILALAKIFLQNKNEIFTDKWKRETFSSEPQDFIKSGKIHSYYAPYSYGRFWFLNSPHKNGKKVFPSLPSDVAVINGLEGQMLAVFPSQNAIYLRLASDRLGAQFDRGKHLTYFFNEFLK